MEEIVKENNIKFTAEIATELCKSINKLKEKQVTFTGGINTEAAIYNKDGSLSIDYDKKREIYYLEIEKESMCYQCGRNIVNFESNNLDDFLLIIKCIDF